MAYPSDSKTAGAAVVLAALGLLFAACNRVESSPGEAASAASSSASGEPAEVDVETASAPPPGSGLTSLGPDAETRIYYQYIDARGSVRFAERLDDVPEAWRDKVGYLELDSPPPMTPADAQRVRDERYARANPRASSGSSSGDAGRAMDRFGPKVVLYYADWCGYCKRAKAHLDRQGVEYELRDVDNPHIKQELFAKTGGGGIPVIEIDGRIMKGYNAQRLDEMLDEI
jgi:glutaredoxin